MANLRSRVLVSCSALVFSLVAACGSPPTEPGPAPNAVAHNDDFVHECSGMRFPAEVGEFKRGEIKYYDRAKRDVSVGYNRLGPLYNFSVTVYSYPGAAGIGDDGYLASVSHDELQAAWPGIVGNIADANAESGFRWLEQREVNLDQGRQRLDGYYGYGKFNNPLPLGPVPFQSYVFVFPTKRGFLKYRFSFSETLGAQGPALMEKFLVRFRWPEGFSG